MKIVRNHPSQLILADRPYFWAAFGFIGTMVFAGAAVMTAGHSLLAALGFGAGALFWAGVSSLIIKRVQVIFNQETGKVRLRQRSAWRYLEDIYPLDEVRSMLRATSHSDGTALYRYELVMADGKQVPLHDSYTNVGRPASLVHAVNAWLDSRNGAA